MIATDFRVITEDQKNVLKISADNDGIWIADALEEDCGFCAHFSPDEAREIVDCITRLLEQ